MTARDRERLLRALSVGVAALWRSLEKIHARQAEAERRLAALERRVGAAPLEARVSAGQAARMLGCDVGTVRRHVRAGRLSGAAIRLPGAKRRRWTVELVSIESLLPASARSEAEFSGAPRARKGG